MYHNNLETNMLCLAVAAVLGFLLARPLAEAVTKVLARRTWRKTYKLWFRAHTMADEPLDAMTRQRIVEEIVEAYLFLDGYETESDEELAALLQAFEEERSKER
jgi:hypothetical protein